MAQNTLIKEKMATLIKENGLVDEQEKMVLTKLMVRKSTKELTKEVAKTAAKAVVTSLFLGYYSMRSPVDFVVVLNNDRLILIHAPRKGLLIEKPRVSQKEIDNRIEIKKEEIQNITFRKVMGGYKMDIALFTDEVIMVDIVKKSEEIFKDITIELGFPFYCK